MFRLERPFFFDPRIIFDRHDPRETSIGSKLELLARERAGGRRRVDCVSRQAAPLRARCAVTRHAPFTPIATNTCITAAVSKFAPPSTLTHCPPPPLLRPFYLERQPSATKRSDCFAEQYSENFIQL